MTILKLECRYNSDGKLEDGNLLLSFRRADSEYLEKQILSGKTWTCQRESGLSTMIKLYV